jgi:hypothetical protein
MALMYGKEKDAVQENGVYVLLGSSKEVHLNIYRGGPWFLLVFREVTQEIARNGHRSFILP